MSFKRAYKSCSVKILSEWFKDHEQPSFRGRQIHDWLFRKLALDSGEMKNLPKSLRDQLDADFSFCAVTPVATVKASDGTLKFLLRLNDDETIESVLIPSRDRDTVCISSQVGCPVGCVFCATGRHGLVRNLTAEEIVDQVIFACRRLGRRVTNIVVMGMGEPLLNLDNLLPALRLLTDADGLDLGARRVTVSTSGIPDGIRVLAAESRQWNLAWSLHAPDEATRARLIPARHRYSIDAILAACVEYTSATGRKVTFEYALIHGVNDSLEQAAGVARLAAVAGAKVNVIPYNEVGRGLQCPTDADVRNFVASISARGVVVTVRESRGRDIAAACGQLRGGRE